MELACEGGICSKHGGDELLGAIPGIHDEKKLKAAIEKFIEDYNEASEKPYKVSASIGIYNSEDDISFKKMFSDIEVYREKLRELKYEETHNAT
jgi:GGDEF domain-containing protein